MQFFHEKLFFRRLRKNVNPAEHHRTTVTLSQKCRAVPIKNNVAPETVYVENIENVRIGTGTS